MNLKLAPTAFKRGLLSKTITDQWKLLRGDGTSVPLPLTGPGTNFPIKLPMAQIFALWWARRKWTIAMSMGSTLVNTSYGVDSYGSYDESTETFVNTASSTIVAPYGYGKNVQTPITALSNEGFGYYLDSVVPLPDNGVPSFLQRSLINPQFQAAFSDSDDVYLDYTETGSSQDYPPDGTAHGSYTTTGTTTGQTPGEFTTTGSYTDDYGNVTPDDGTFAGYVASSVFCGISLGYQFQLLTINPGFGAQPIPGTSFWAFAIVDDVDPTMGWLGIQITSTSQGLSSNPFTNIILTGGDSSSFSDYVESGTTCYFDGTQIPLYVESGQLSSYDVIGYPPPYEGAQWDTFTTTLTQYGSLVITTSSDPYTG